MHLVCNELFAELRKERRACSPASCRPTGGWQRSSSWHDLEHSPAMPAHFFTHAHINNQIAFFGGNRAPRSYQTREEAVLWSTGIEKCHNCKSKSTQESVIPTWPLAIAQPVLSKSGLNLAARSGVDGPVASSQTYQAEGRTYSPLCSPLLILPP